MSDIAVTVRRGCFSGVCSLKHKIWGESVMVWKWYSKLNSLQCVWKLVTNSQLISKKGDLECDNFSVNHHRSTWKPAKFLFLMMWAQTLIERETPALGISMAAVNEIWKTCSFLFFYLGFGLVFLSEEVSPETTEVPQPVGYYVKLSCFTFGMGRLWPMKPW